MKPDANKVKWEDQPTHEKLETLKRWVKVLGNVNEGKHKKVIGILEKLAEDCDSPLINVAILELKK